MLFGIAPDLSRLKVFGCFFFAKNLQVKNKFDQWAKMGIFISYPFSQKGYRIYDIESKTIYVSHDVLFYEHIFPFKDVKSPVFSTHVTNEFLFDEFFFESNTLLSPSPNENISSSHALHERDPPLQDTDPSVTNSSSPNTTHEHIITETSSTQQPSSPADATLDSSLSLGNQNIQTPTRPQRDRRTQLTFTIIVLWLLTILPLLILFLRLQVRNILFTILFLTIVFLQHISLFCLPLPLQPNQVFFMRQSSYLSGAKPWRMR